jgi:hypothetical protein
MITLSKIFSRHHSPKGFIFVTACKRSAACGRRISPPLLPERQDERSRPAVVKIRLFKPPKRNVYSLTVPYAVKLVSGSLFGGVSRPRTKGLCLPGQRVFVRSNKGSLSARAKGLCPLGQKVFDSLFGGKSENRSHFSITEGNTNKI